MAVPAGAHVHNSWSLGKLTFSTVMDFSSIIPAPWSYYKGNGKIWLQYSHVVSVYSMRKISPNTANTIFNALFYLGSNHTCHSLNYCD